MCKGDFLHGTHGWKSNFFAVPLQGGNILLRPLSECLNILFLLGPFQNQMPPVKMGGFQGIKGLPGFQGSQKLNERKPTIPSIEPLGHANPLELTKIPKKSRELSLICLERNVPNHYFFVFGFLLGGSRGCFVGESEAEGVSAQQQPLERFGGVARLFVGAEFNKSKSHGLLLTVGSHLGSYFHGTGLAFLLEEKVQVLLGGLEVEVLDEDGGGEVVPVIFHFFLVFLFLLLGGRGEGMVPHGGPF